MTRIGVALGLAGAFLMLGVRDVAAGEKPSRPLDPRTPELVLHYDFYGVEGEQVSDCISRTAFLTLLSGRTAN